MIGGRWRRPVLETLVACGSELGLTTLVEWRWPSWNLTVEYNPSMLEGASWWTGRLDLPSRLWDTALAPDTHGVYNVFPPLLSAVGFAATTGWAHGGRGPLPAFEFLPLVLFGIAPLVVAYRVFRSRCQTAPWAILLLLAWYAGTAMWPCTVEARKDGVNHLLHILSQIGLLVLAGEMLGRRRTWVLIAALAVAGWSRQLTIFFGAAAGPQFPVRRGVGGRRLAGAVAGLALVLAVPMALNWAKFGSPFESGYRHIYVGRTTGIADDARAHGLFSTHFILKNAYYFMAATPWGREETGLWTWSPSPEGASVWLTSPILILAACAAVRWWADRRARWLMLASIPVFVAHLCYHNTGYIQWGYCRFALDYIPVWLVVAAPWLTTGRRRWWTIGCVTWSVVYFSMIARWTPPPGV